MGRKIINIKNQKKRAMKKYLSILFSLSLIVVFLSGCEETRLEKAQDYDFDKIEPVVNGLTGPTEVPASGLAATKYQLNDRFGSTYAWSVTGHAYTAAAVEGEPGAQDITFAQTGDTVYVTVDVTETTSGGKTATASLNVTLLPFCPVTMSEWEGDYTGTEADTHGPTVTMEATGEPNEMRVYNLAWFVPNAWGENWTNGDGSCLMQFKCGNEVVISKQWIGDSDYPDVYGIVGTGTFDPATHTVVLTYDVAYSWDGEDGSWNGPWTTTLVLN